MTSRLGDLLRRRGVLTAEQLEAALAGKAEHEGGLASGLVDLGLVDERTLVRELADEYRLPGVKPRTADVPRFAPAPGPPPLARGPFLVPIGMEGPQLTVAMADPTNPAALAELKFPCGLDVRVAIAGPTAVRDTIDRLYGAASELADALSGLGPETPATDPAAEGGAAADAEQAPGVPLVNPLLAEAVRRRASDVHVEPYERSLRI